MVVMETSGNVEILVHVTAPCKTTDDARYRALAQAYLDFQPTTQTKIFSRETITNAETVIPSSPAEPDASRTSFEEPIPSSQATQRQTSPLVPCREPAPEFSFKSVELSFRSVVDNINSPGLGRPAKNIVPSSQPGTQSQFHQSSWIAHPSVVDDSQPANNFSFSDFSSPSRLFEHLAGQFESQEHLYSQPVPSQSQQRAPAFSVEASQRSQEEEDEDEDDGQVILVTSSDSSTSGGNVPLDPASSTENIVLSTPFPTSKRPPIRSSPYEQVIQDTPCNPTRKRPPATSPSRAGSEPPPSSKRHKRSAPISESRSITRSTSDVGPGSAGNLYRPIRPPNQRHLSYLEQLEIHPAGPPVAADELTPADLLTPKLRELARQLNMAKRYRPAEQRRDLRPFERGHWLLDWASWRPTLRERAWHFLTDYILEGFAGWGVWCKRADDWSWLRIYCWGHVAGHVYLALYLASERALKTDGARWIDSAGEVVVVTNGHDNSESGESLGEDGSEQG